MIVVDRLGKLGRRRLRQRQKAAKQCPDGIQLKWLLQCAGHVEPSLAADAQSVIDDPAVDALIIVTPTTTHRDLVHAVIRAGKPLLCEKPLATTSRWLGGSQATRTRWCYQRDPQRQRVRPCA